MKFFCSSLLILLTTGIHSQTNTATLNIGDPAPPVKVRKWIKGNPVNTFEKGKVYVIEFWATWCGPCIGGMPHFSELARKYRDKVSISGISILERKNTTDARVDAFVDSMGKRMDYNVAAEDSNYMAEGWLRASGERGIPMSYVIDQQGRIAWIGLPKRLDEVLPKVLNNNWPVEEALARRNEERRLKAFDNNEVILKLNPYMGRPGKPDSALLVISNILKDYPELKYAPRMGHFTFYSLIKTDQKKAYSYGKELMAASSYDDPPYKSISDAVEYMTEVIKTEITKELYELGAEAYQAQIDNYPWSMNLPATYTKIAEWYLKAGQKEKQFRRNKRGLQQKDSGTG